MKLKQFIVLLLLTATAASAQSIAVNTTDPQTGSRLILTKNHKGIEIDVDDTVSKIGLLFFSAGYQSTVVDNKTVEAYYIDLDMYHNNDKLGCIKQSENNVLITLVDGTEIQCFQMSETECRNDAYKAAFALCPKKDKPGEMEQNFKKLQTVGISKIEVTTTESSLFYKIPKKSSDYIKGHFALVAKTKDAATKS